MNHIHLGTKDLKKSVDFYSTLFGFKKKFDHDPGIFLENKEGFLLAIDPVDEVPKLPGWYHLGFCLKTEKETLEVYKKCKDLEVPIVHDLMQKENDYAAFFITDPDGNKIEVSWHNE